MAPTPLYSTGSLPFSGAQWHGTFRSVGCGQDHEAALRFRCLRRSQSWGSMPLVGREGTGTRCSSLFSSQDCGARAEPHIQSRNQKITSKTRRNPWSAGCFATNDSMCLRLPSTGSSLGGKGCKHETSLNEVSHPLRVQREVS